MSQEKIPLISDYVITPHCYFEMKRRVISEATVRSVLAAPGQSFFARVGRIVLQSQLKISGKIHLI